MPSTHTAKPRILHVTTVHRPYDTRIFHKEARALAARGYNVSLATTIDRPQARDGIDLLPLGDRSGSRIFRIGRDARALVTMLRNLDALIHIHDPELLLVSLLPVLCGARVIYDVHEFYAERIPASRWLPAPLRRVAATLYRYAEKAIVPRLAGVVVVSEAMVPMYERYLTAERIALVRNYPYFDDNDVALARRTPHPLGGKPYALHTGGAMRLRAFHDLVGAGEYLHARDADLKLVNLGEVSLSEYSPTERDALMRRAARAGIMMVGQLSFTETLTWLAHAESAYLPLIDSPNNRRGMPNKLFEYLGFGLPIVASDVGRVGDIVRRSGCGIVVAPDDGAAHGAALEHLHHNQEERSVYARSAVNAGVDYHFDRECDRLASLYEHAS